MSPSIASALRRFFALLLLPCVALAQAPATPPAQTFSKEQLDQMVAPIALYPDSLLSQVLMASTYPADVADAAKWSKANPNQKGDAAVKAVESQPWDPAVKSLVAFPQVLLTMGDKPDWVQNLGDAFLASSKDVLDSAQRLRAQAQKAGNLKTTEQQKVVVEQAPTTQTTVIKIEPANPQVVYVPTYNPTVVYGVWAYPAYPPYYWPPPPGYAVASGLAAGIAFGVGVGITNSLWGNTNWGRGDVDINVNRYNNINVNKQISANQTNFQHNAANRKGVPYRDSASQQKFGKNVAGADQRGEYRGRDPARDAQRQQAQASLQDRNMDPAKSREQLRNDPQTRERAQSAAERTDRAGAGKGTDRAQSRPGGDGVQRAGADRAASRPSGGAAARDNAFAGANKPAATKQQVDRGNASRQQMAQHGGGARAGGHGGGGRRK